MNDQHTPTPWKTGDKRYSYTPGVGDCCAIYAKDGSGLIAFVLKKEGVENARRIVAAVNATAGWSTQALENGTPAWLRENYPQQRAEIDRLRQENAELAKTVDGYNRMLCRRDEEITELVEAVKGMLKTCFTEDESKLSLIAVGKDLSDELERRCEKIGAAFTQARAALEKQTAHPTTTNTSSTAETSEEKHPADARRLMDAARALVKHLHQRHPWVLGEEFLNLLSETTDALRDPHGWEPRGIITPAGSGTAETSEEDLPAQVIANLTRKLGNAIKALRMIATYTPETGQCDDGYSPKYIAQAAIAPYGPGPMIQERPRPGQDHTAEPDPSDLYREWKDAQDDADQPTAYDP